MLIRYKPKVDHIKVITLSPTAGKVPSRKTLPLYVGMNEISESDWICARPNLKDEIRRGEIQSISQYLNRPNYKNLKDLPVQQAVRYVDECTSIDTLKEWYKVETRNEARVHITKKLEEYGVEISEIELSAPGEEGSASNEGEAPIEETSNDADDVDLELFPKREADKAAHPDAEPIDYAAIPTLTRPKLIKLATSHGLAPKDAMRKNKDQLVDWLNHLAD